MSKIEMVKAIGGIVVSVGVAAIMGNLVKATTPVNTSLIGRVCILIGGAVLTDMVTDVAAEHAEKKMNDAIASFKKEMSEVTA